MAGEQGDYANHSELIHRLRLKVGGQLGLFVGNRPDPTLEQELEDTLEIELDWCENQPRRVQAAAKRVRQRRYGLVIVATGFVGHCTDRMLSRAASSVGTLYIRADHGRVRGTLRALARVFGLQRGKVVDHEV